MYAECIHEYHLYLLDIYIYNITTNNTLSYNTGSAFTALETTLREGIHFERRIFHSTFATVCIVLYKFFSIYSF